MRRAGFLVVLAALIAVAGAVVMRRTASSALVAVSAVAQDAGNMVADEQTNRVFIAQTQSRRVGVLDARNGRLLRVVDLDRDPYSPNPFNPWRFAVDTAHERVFVTSNASGAVAVLDARSGHVVRIVNASRPGDRFGSVLALASSGRLGRLYALWPPGLLQRATLGILDEASGRVLHSTDFGPLLSNNVSSTSLPAMIAVDERRGRVAVISPTDDGVLLFDARTGALVKSIRFSPLAANGLALPSRDVDAVDMDVATGHTFVVTNKSVTMLDTRSGRILRVVTGRLFYGSIYVDDGTRSVFVGTARFAGNRALASIWELDSRSGLPRRAIVADELPFLIVPDQRRHRLLVSGLALSPGTMTADGSRMSVLDTATGAVHPVAGVSMDQGEIAVDGRTDRLFVLSQGGQESSDPWAWLPSWLRRWLPFLAATPPRSQPTHATVTTLDLSRL